MRTTNDTKINTPLVLICRGPPAPIESQLRISHHRQEEQKMMMIESLIWNREFPLCVAARPPPTG